MKVNQLRAGVIMTYVNIGLGSLIPFVYTPHYASVARAV